MKSIEATRRTIVAIRPDATVHAAAQTMEQANVGSLVVIDGTTLVGIVTDRDLVRRALARGLSPRARVDGVMSMPVHTIEASNDLHTAFGLFRRHGVRRLVVVEETAVKGMLSVDDLLVDISSDLFDLARPLDREMLIGHRDAPGSRHHLIARWARTRLAGHDRRTDRAGGGALRRTGTAAGTGEHHERSLTGLFESDGLSCDDGSSMTTVLP